jgi:hypothetical protein
MMKFGEHIQGMLIIYFRNPFINTYTSQNTTNNKHITLQAVNVQKTYFTQWEIHIYQVYEYKVL